MSLTRAGVVIDHAKVSANVGGGKGMRGIKKIFSISTIGHNNTRKTITCCKTVTLPTRQKVFVIPRFGGFMLKDAKILDCVQNKLQTGEDRVFVPDRREGTSFILTQNQRCVMDHLISHIYTPERMLEGSGSTILQMDPGYGKTYLAMGLINHLRKKTFIIVPNTYLLRQWRDALNAAFPESIIGCYYGIEKTDGDIVISIVNSALNYPDYDKFGLIIYDEVHMYCSSKSSVIFSRAQSTCCLGLTATPNSRIDKFDPVAQWALGQVVYADKLPGWCVNDIKFTTKVTRLIYNGHPDHTKIIESAAGIVSVPLMVNQLLNDPYRNNLIVAYAIHLYRMSMNVFVFSDRREHLHELAMMLSNQKIKYDAPELELQVHGADSDDGTHIDGVRELMGGSTDVDIESAKKEGRIIMTTYQYSGTGVSINKMNALILATPRKSNMKQILGRIYRLKSDQSIRRQIIDIVDNRICLKSQFYTRKKTYIDGLHACIVDKKMRWDDCIDMESIELV